MLVGAAPPERKGGRWSEEKGWGLVELLVAMALLLVVMVSVYSFMDSSRREFVNETELATARDMGRAAMDILAGDVMGAGYSPLGARFRAVPAGDSFTIRLLADRDGDGVVGTPSEVDENVSYEFLDPDGDGLFDLRRGIDSSGDGDFSDTGESVESIASNVVPVDIDNDNNGEPFLSYDIAPPQTGKVRIVFGIRSRCRDVLRNTFPVVQFQNEIGVRNLR